MGVRCLQWRERIAWHLPLTNGLAAEIRYVCTSTLLRAYEYALPTILQHIRMVSHSFVSQMVNVNPRHVLTPNPRMMVAFTGFESDVQSLSQVLSVEVQSKLGRAIGLSVGASSQKSSIISPKAMASLTSHVLYKRRNAPYYVEPLIVGLQEVGGKEKKFRPYLCQMDCIGAKSSSKEFVCGGLASNSLYGTSEALWEPDLEPDRLLKVCAQAFQSALERDCLSGYGTTIYMITKDGIEEYDLANRND